MTHAKIVSFTGRGAALAERVRRCLKDTLSECYDRADDKSLRKTALSRFAQQAMVDCDLLIFIGAAGIAVRAVAPYLAGKAFDPAVLVLDENGRFVISLLSGHLGGANEYTGRLADALGAEAVITTATDGRGVFAVDTWAKSQNLIVRETARIREVSAALLRGERVGFRCAGRVEGRIPPGLETRGDFPVGVSVGVDTAAEPFSCTLHLIPRAVRLGIGCRRGTSADAIDAAASAALRQAGLPFEALRGAATIDRKADEPGLAAFCAASGLPLQIFTASELAAVPGEFTPSAFVRETVGVENVCERAAVASAGNGRLLLRKTALNGVTVALAAEEWRICFEADNGGD